MRTARNDTTNYGLQCSLKRGFASVISLFFGFLLVFLQAQSANDHPIENGIEDNLIHPSEADLFFCSTQPPHFPFESTPVPWEPKSTDKEGETSDNLDGEHDKIFYRASLRLRVDFAAIKRELSQQSLSSANDERVPLFVLHHSWKTFMHEISCFSTES